MPTQVMAFYAVPPDAVYPYERVGHFVKELVPEGFREISKEEADQINADVTARTPAPQQLQSAGMPAPSVDLGPILDKLDALTRTVVSHAELHDQHTQALLDTAAKAEEQTKAIKDVKVATAKAIAQSLEGIGEKPA